MQTPTQPFLLIADHKDLPVYALTPPMNRRFAYDRSGELVGAYAASRLLDSPEESVVFSFGYHDGQRWVDLPDRVALGLMEREEDSRTFDLRMHDNGGDIAGVGSYLAASHAILGNRANVRGYTLNPMLLACALQSRVDHACREKAARVGHKVVAFLESA